MMDTTSVTQAGLPWTLEGSGFPFTILTDADPGTRPPVSASQRYTRTPAPPPEFAANADPTESTSAAVPTVAVSSALRDFMELFLKQVVPFDMRAGAASEQSRSSPEPARAACPSWPRRSESRTHS